MAGHSTKGALTDSYGHKRMDIGPMEARSSHSGRVDAVPSASVWSRCFSTASNPRRQAQARWPAPSVLGLAGHELFLALFQVLAKWL
jgi:hypothetical protein